MLKKNYFLLHTNIQSWLTFFQFLCSKPSLINVPIPCRSEEEEDGRNMCNVWGQNYVHTFGRPMHTGKENKNQF